MSEKKRKIKISVSIPTAEMEKLRMLGERTDRSLSWIVGRAIGDFYDAWSSGGRHGSRPVPEKR